MHSQALVIIVYIRASVQENLSLGVANNRGANQPAHTRSLISTFVVRLTERLMSRHSTSENSMFLLVSVAEQANLNITLSETPKTGFAAVLPINNACIL